MQIDIKENEPCKLTVHYTADALEILNKRADVLNSFKKAPVPGFRPGKATIEVIKVHYRDQIEESLKRALAEDAFHNTIFEKKLRPHGAPRFNSLLMVDGKFTCEFEIFVKPSFELAPFKDIELPSPHSDMDINALTESMLQDLRVRFGEAIPFNDTDCLNIGDNAILDYEGFVDGVKMDGLSGSGEMMTMGKTPVPDFDSKLLGMMIGETKEFDVVAPDTSLPSIAGKTVHFKATLQMGSRTLPMPLDDTLAQKAGRKDLEELRTFVQGTATAKVEGARLQKLHEIVSAKLIDDNQIDVPNWLSLSEAQYLCHKAQLDWNTLPDVDKEKYLEMGAKNVKLSLILDKVRETEPDAQLSDQEVFEIIKRNLAQTQVKSSVDDVLKEMQRTGYLQILFARIKDEHTMDFIVKQIKLVD